MQIFNGWQYLLIDLANAFGLDKLLFKERIEWAEKYVNNLHETLEDMVGQADNKPLYMKACMAIRKAQRGEPTGHLVGLDACCSGIQVMSALTGCVVGATNTGLVNPNVRADAYTICTDIMNQELGGGLVVSRGDAKDALMTSYYGSKKVPKEIFGEDTPELSAFYQGAFKVAPGAWELLQDLLGSWQPYALEHRWKLPDGFDARVKVMQKKETRIEVDELDHATFTYEYYENEGTKAGLSNVANVVHSVDAYILRCIHRRCNYQADDVSFVQQLIQQEQGRRLIHDFGAEPLLMGTQLGYYVGLYIETGMADAVILPYINATNVDQLSDEHLRELEELIDTLLVHKPFEIITVHDEFKCHPNNMNHLRQHYINVFAELADSNLLASILSQIHGKPGTFTKLSNNLSTLIRGSNYALS
jgi:hypothetical protein